MKNYTELAEYLLAQAKDYSPQPERQTALAALANYLRTSRLANRPARLNFICTHNSRRSHFGQVMAQVLAAHMAMNIETFSGGTEATAFHPNAVNALLELGVDIEKPAAGANPRYRVRTGKVSTEAFSKVYSSEPNPQRDFAAILVCSSADAGCPVVAGAELRIALPFEDPKVSDGTAEAASTYRQRALEIGTELAWAFQMSEQTKEVAHDKT